MAPNGSTWLEMAWVGVLTVYARAPSGCLLDDGGGVGKFLVLVGEECPLARARMGRAALAVLGYGGGVVKFLDVPGRSWGRGGRVVRWHEPDVGGGPH